eukprot:4078744-Pyramimonas_sp.AAC.1
MHTEAHRRKRMTVLTGDFIAQVGRHTFRLQPGRNIDRLHVGGPTGLASGTRFIRYDVPRPQLRSSSCASPTSSEQHRTPTATTTTTTQ